ncbi:MAG: acyltransferase family protein, partial [Actinomycetia bacterium]|nr:acyltransferase family protein [Actinomycetes bacterium]
FTISGFLITALLVREFQGTGRVALGPFWLRRARRLLPAMAVTVAVCVGAAGWFGRDALVGVWRQIAGALTFSTNWIDIATSHSYFQNLVPDLFRNFWSLGVEVQFYLVWPAILVLLLRQRRIAHRRVWAAVLLACASAGLMAVLFQPGGDPTRVYYGADTHAFGLLLGAALGLLVMRRESLPAQAPANPPMDPPAEIPHLAPVDQPLQPPVEQAEEVPADVPAEPSPDQPVECPEDQPEEAPAEQSDDLPAEPPEEIPADDPQDHPEETADEIPPEPPERIPVDEGPDSQPAAEPHAHPRLRSARVAHWLTGSVAGSAALLGLVACAVLMDDAASFTYRGGLVLASLLTALVIYAAVAPGSRLGWALNWRPLAWLGERSYGIYLWHWPVYTLLLLGLPAQLGSSHAWLLGAIDAVASVVAAALSYRLVETPVRRLGFRGYARAVRTGLRRTGPGPMAAAHKGRPKPAANARPAPAADSAPTSDALGQPATPPARPARWALVAAVAACAVVIGSVAVAVRFAPPRTAAEDYILSGQQALATMSQPADTTPETSPITYPETVSPSLAPTPGQGSSTAPRPSDTRTPSPKPTRPPLPPGNKIDAIGDSVMLAAAPSLLQSFPGIRIDAKVSRSMLVGPQMVQALAQGGRLRPVVVVSLVTNGYFSTAVLQQILDATGPHRLLVLVTAHGARAWIPPGNQLLKAFAKAHPATVVVADWDAAIAPHLNLLASDGIHPGPSGAQIYTRTIQQAIKTYAAAHPAPKW